MLGITFISAFFILSISHQAAPHGMWHYANCQTVLLAEQDASDGDHAIHDLYTCLKNHGSALFQYATTLFPSAVPTSPRKTNILPTSTQDFYPNIPLRSSDPVYPATPIVGPVYYVAPYGDDSRTKTQAANPSTPWRTLQKAANSVTAGDTILVKDGVYKDRVGSGNTWTVEITRSGTADKPIRFVSENKWGATLDGEYVNHTVVRVQDVSHIIFEGFEIRHGAWGGIRTQTSSSHITIRSNWIHNNTNHRMSDECGTADAGYGRVGIGTGLSSRYWTVDGNLIHSNGRLPGGCANDDFKHDHGWYAQGHGHIAQNNIFFDHHAGWDMKVDGSMIAGTFPENERTMTILNNTFASRNEGLGKGRAQIRFFRNKNERPRNVLIMNNVFWNTPGAAAIRANGGGWPWPGVEIVNNITTAGAIITPGTESDVLLLANNVANAPLDLGLVSPKSIRATADDFQLTSQATLLIDKGKATHMRTGLPNATSPTTDHIGTKRPQGHARDLGAFEWPQ
jgi:hypothetical protein